MPHIHDLIDFTVVAYITYKNKVLLVQHKNLNAWMPVGGHIELDEDPDEALVREIKEESGLDVEIIAEKVKFKIKDVKPLYTPTFLNIHQLIGQSHRHIVFIYFAKAKSLKVKLAEREHNEIRWFTEQELDDKKYLIREDIKFYALKALKALPS